MLDMILAFKECLALILLTGIITGLFFAKARNKEEYEPAIEEIKEKLYVTNSEIDEIDEICKLTAEEIENEKKSTQQINNEIDAIKTKIDKLKKEFFAVNGSVDKLKEKHSSIKALLKAQSQKVEELKSKIGSFTPEALLEKEIIQKEKLKTLKEQLNHAKDTLNEAATRHKNLKIQKDELYEKITPLEKSIANVKDLLENAKMKEKTIEKELRDKISSMKNNYSHLLERIKNYKTELLKLKES